MNQVNTKTIFIAGGGTGGHIYPAIAIGRAIQKNDPKVQLRFVGTAQGLESKIMQRENLTLDLIQSGKLNFKGKFWQKTKSIFKIPFGIFQSVLLILKYKPQFILGVGGYASAPFLIAAIILCRRAAIWEPNAHPGMANRLLSFFIKKAYVVFDDTRKHLKSKKIQVLGMPLREEIERAQTEERSRISERLTILCFGGSQGSLFLNEKMSDFILAHPDLHEKIYLIHQTGPIDYDKMKQKYGALNCVETHEFIYDMPSQYRKADIQFCRGGASTIAEAAAFGVVPLIVPLPAADDHQLRNAEVVQNHKAGFLFKQTEFSDKNFADLIKQLLVDVNLRKELAANLKKLAPKEAASQIARDILSQI